MVVRVCGEGLIITRTYTHTHKYPIKVGEWIVSVFSIYTAHISKPFLNYAIFLDKGKPASTTPQDGSLHSQLCYEGTSKI